MLESAPQVFLVGGLGGGKMRSLGWETWQWRLFEAAGVTFSVVFWWLFWRDFFCLKKTSPSKVVDIVDAC